MISIGKVRDADYYLAEIGQDDAAGYYVGDETPGRWLGTLAADLGLAGAVDADDFRVLLVGKMPGNGQSLTEHPVKVRALDLTLSVPKSVSVVWALGDRRTRLDVERALDVAEAAVVDFIEQEGTKIRRGHAGAILERGSGLVVAAFDHRTSRSGDPNLHRHLVVANASRGPDGRITALDTRQLYRIRYTAEAVFQAVLRNELAQSVGPQFTSIDRHGVGELVGVSRKVIRHFSQRRRDIEAEMIWRGATTGHGARIAALATREAKGNEPSPELLEHRWRQRAEDLGFDFERIPREPRVPGLDVSDEQLATAVTEHESTFGRWDAIRSVCRSAPDGVPLGTLLSRTSEYLASTHAISLAPDTFTTPEILALEQSAVKIAEAGRGIGSGVAPAAPVGDAVAARPRLAPEQRRLVERIASSGDAISVVIGQAGAGKTTALDALRDAYQRGGHRVIGATLSARAAAELRSGAGIESQTIHRLLTLLDSGRPLLKDHTVLVIDEAAMVGTRQLARIIDHANQARSKLVLVGDNHQLPEIGAGGTFSAIARRVEPVRLTENRRQHDPVQRRALSALRRVDVDQALVDLERSGNLTTAADADTLRTALVADWLAAVDGGHHAIMLAATRSDVADLNRRAVELFALADRSGPIVWRSELVAFAGGQRIVAHRNRHDLGLLNGDQGIVNGSTPEGMSIELDRGGRVEVPSAYVESGHLTHGYALTVHKAQGMTCDHVYFLGDDGLYAELAYTGLSRGRHVNHLYAVASRAEYGVARYDAFSDIRRSLAVSRSKTAAIDHGIDGPDFT